MIHLLDHGYIRLVSYSQPVPIEGDVATGASAENLKWTGDLEIVRAARTSYNADWRTGDDAGKDERLIHYLWENGHTTPFEAMTLTFEIQAPIFVFRQWHRHRTQSYNEMSARYVQLPDLFYIPKPEHVGYQDPKTKQARKISPHIEGDGQKLHNALAFTEALREANAEAYIEYESFLELGIPREVARMLLPLNTYSRMFATMNLRNAFHFLSLRLEAHAQYEIRVYAEAMLELIEPVCPISCQAFENSIDFAPVNDGL